MPIIQARMAFTKTKKMYRIQHIGLTYAIKPRQAIEPRRKVEGLRRITFKIGQFQLREMHPAKVTMNYER